MKKLVILSGVLAAGLATGAALAEDQSPSGPHGAAMWDELDANGDGQVTLGEMTEHQRAMFAEADADGNGAISKAEMKTHFEKRHGEMGARMLGDANGDGVVTRAEYDSRSAEHFDEIDANHDGALSDEEIAAAHKGRHHRGRG